MFEAFAILLIWTAIGAALGFVIALAGVLVLDFFQTLGEKEVDNR